MFESPFLKSQTFVETSAFNPSTNLFDKSEDNYSENNDLEANND